MRKIIIVFSILIIMFLASFSTSFASEVIAIDGSDPDPTDKIPIKKISATKSVYSGDIHNLIDGNREGSHALFLGTGDVWVQLELDKVFIIDQIILSARRNWANYRYEIAGSLDGSSWSYYKDLGTYEYDLYDYEPYFQTMNFYSGASSPYSMSPFSAKFIRIYIDEQGGYYPGYLYEVELYGSLASTGLDKPEIPINDISSDHNVYSGSLNNLIDGLIGDHALFQTSGSYEPVSITLDLGIETQISQIVIYASRNMANYGYKIEASSDNVHFTTIMGEDPYDYYSYDYEPFVQIMDFNSVTSGLFHFQEFHATFVKITIHDGGGHYYPGYIREIDLFSTNQFHVTGKVKGEVDGQGVFNVPVKIFAGTTLLGSTTTDGYGNYDMSIAPYQGSSGTYTVKYSNTDSASTSQQGNPSSYTVSNVAGSHSIDFEVNNKFILIGKVLDESGPIKGATVNLYSHYAEATTRHPYYNHYIASFDTGDDGIYNFNNWPNDNDDPADSYYVNVSLPVRATLSGNTYQLSDNAGSYTHDFIIYITSLPQGATIGKSDYGYINAPANSYNFENTWSCYWNEEDQNCYNFIGVSVGLDTLLQDFSFTEHLDPIIIHYGNTGFASDNDCEYDYNYINYCSDSTSNPDNIYKVDSVSSFEARASIIESFDPFFSIKAGSSYSHQVEISIDSSNTFSKSISSNLGVEIGPVSFGSSYSRTLTTSSSTKLSWSESVSNDEKFIYVNTWYIQVTGSFDYTYEYYKPTGQLETTTAHQNFETFYPLVMQLFSHKSSTEKCGQFPSESSGVYQTIPDTSQPQEFSDSDLPFSVEVSESNSLTTASGWSIELKGSYKAITGKIGLSSDGSRTSENGISIKHTFTKTTGTVGIFYIQYLNGMEIELYLLS